MKAKLNKELLKKYGFGMGGDMNENIYIAVDVEGNPIERKDFNEYRGTTQVMSVHALGQDDEYLVVDHPNPITRELFNKFRVFFNTDLDNSLNALINEEGWDD